MPRDSGVHDLLKCSSALLKPPEPSSFAHAATVFDVRTGFVQCNLVIAAIVVVVVVVAAAAAAAAAITITTTTTTTTTAAPQQQRLA